MGAQVPTEKELARDASSQMALDESVLELALPGAVILRFYRWSGPAVTFGRGQSWEEARRAADARGWTDASPVRRPTGGGVVFHDGDITFSLVFPWERLCGASAVYKNIHRGIHQGLRRAAIQVSILSAASRPGVGGVCFTSPVHMDLIAPDDAKVLGGALARRRGKGLYQGSMRPEALGRPREELEAAVVSGLALEFGDEPVRDIEPAWLERARALEPRYRAESWNRRL